MALESENIYSLQLPRLALRQHTPTVFVNYIAQSRTYCRSITFLLLTPKPYLLTDDKIFQTIMQLPQIALILSLACSASVAIPEPVPLCCWIEGDKSQFPLEYDFLQAALQLCNTQLGDSDSDFPCCAKPRPEGRSLTEVWRGLCSGNIKQGLGTGFSMTLPNKLSYSCGTTFDWQKDTCV